MKIMKVKFPQTDANLKAAGLTRESWARTRGFVPSTVHRIFNEPDYPDGPTKTAVIEKLRSEKFLAEDVVEESAAA